MTVINTNYSSIEEAWGTPLNQKKKSRRPPPDPLCDLYAKRNQKTKRPYSETAANSALSVYSKLPYNGRMTPTATANGYDATKPVSYRPILASSSEDIYETRHHQDEDDAYFDRALSGDNTSLQGARLIAYDQGNPYHPPGVTDNFSDYGSDPIPDPDVSNTPAPTSNSQEQSQRPPIVSTNYNSKSGLGTNSSHNSHEKILDLGLYIISGVLMIFTMEQILQLGMRMKRD